MSTQVLSKGIKALFSRQERTEKELGALKEVVRAALIEEQIRPSVLKRWERISRDIDRGKGRFFRSIDEVNKWLKMTSRGG